MRCTLGSLHLQLYKQLCFAQCTGVDPAGRYTGQIAVHNELHPRHGKLNCCTFTLRCRHRRVWCLRKQGVVLREAAWALVSAADWSIKMHKSPQPYLSQVLRYNGDFSFVITLKSGVQTLVWMFPGVSHGC